MNNSIQNNQQLKDVHIRHTISTPIRIPIKNNIKQQNYGMYSIILSVLIILVVIFGM